MFKPKSKKGKNLAGWLHARNILVIAIVLASGLFLLKPHTAHAAAAQCYAPLFAGASVTACDDTSRAKCGSVACPSGNGKFEDNHCYQLQQTGFGPVYGDVSCNPPFAPAQAAASGSTAPGSADLGSFNNGAAGKNSCGGVQTSLDLGCKGTGNPISQLLFAIVRFLSVGVGIMVVGSIIVAGIQYSASQGNPQATAAAQKRIAATVGALFLYIMTYALLNWLVPGGLFK